MTEILTAISILVVFGLGWLLWSHGKLTGLLQAKQVVPTVASLDLKAGAAVDQKQKS